MAMTMRAPSMLPSIKCSNCGNDVEISMMGEHICGGSGQRDAPRGQQYPQRVDSPQLLSLDDGRAHLKPTRFIPPPRIDPSAANRPYAQPNVYASHDARSPEGYGNPRNEYGRRQQIPREPSAQLSSNLDCAFPPFPASPMASTPRSDMSSPSFFSDANPYALSASRRDAPQPRSVSPLSQHDRDEAKRDDFFSRKPSNPKTRPQRKPTNGSDSEYTLHSSNVDPQPQYAAPEQSYRPGQPQAPAQTSRGPPSRPSRPGGEVDNFIASLKEDPVRARGATPPAMAQEMRLNTSSQQPSYGGLSRRPSEPMHNTNRPPNNLPARSATAGDLRNPYAPPASQTAVHPPPRSSSRSGFRPDPRAQDAPPVPSTQQNGRGYETHAPSHSGSSAASSASGVGSLPRTGRTTPMSEASSVSDTKSPPRALHGVREHGNMAPTSESNPYNPYALDSQPKSYIPPTKSYASSPPAPEHNPYAPQDSSSQPPRSLPWSSQAQAQPPTDRPSLPRSNTDISLTSTPSLSRPRHVCRGCTTPIIGKSIKAADGRLTGRYHRTCFVCTTCSTPFSGTEVYVLNDRPFCEQHYHSLNGSLCTSCDKGIEGQYLETERGEKFHPRCLCCSTCREGLGEEYFDVGGRVYCERHAVAEVRRLGGGGGGGGAGGMLGPGGWRAERRRTRLGMFM
ncbi:Paxillin-like protein 1 [Sphaceloma murrayae]|uniref:Paxillin-like protein 1 n=1 Tax=Sphaceloma murrayae TaxID=2082308 RepID=A0A2K1QNC5_9PEZI|nr:Paxillin-like protein 1 [Sphaceloma murrayae]